MNKEDFDAAQDGKPGADPVHDLIPDSTDETSAHRDLELRRRAEEMARAGDTLPGDTRDGDTRDGDTRDGDSAVVPESLAGLSPEETQLVLHELRVHQIELEMQNDELRQSHVELEASRTRYLDLYDLAPVGYLTLTSPGIIVQANLTAANLLGEVRSALTKQALSRFVLPQDQDVYYQHARALFSTGAAQVWEMRLMPKGEDAFWARFEARAIDDEARDARVCHVVMSDITAQKRAEESLHVVQAQLTQQERLAAVGRLAAGIAHDFNNILSIIFLQVQLSVRAADPNPALHARLETIAQQSTRAAELVQQILDFGRRTVLKTHPLDLALFLDAQVGLWRRTIPEDIDIHLYMPEDVCIVNVDSTRMQQMFTNLVLNARDAMPLGGKVSIEVDHIRLAPGEAKPLPQLDAGEYIRVKISDTGMGISGENLPHVFEPFFTTKASSQGTGLGLAQVYGIIKQHDAHIEVHSKIGAGTTFTIYLSKWIGQVPETAPVLRELPVQGHGETILVVEDNGDLRIALMEVLEDLNYRTLAAANGIEALTLLEQQSARIAVVLSDLLMPKMGGKKLLGIMRARGLTVPMIVMSGHPIESELEALEAQGMFGWMPKPPDIHELAKLLARALDKDAD